jgi:hypothetical protein
MKSIAAKDKIVSEGNQTFNVPNNEEGNVFIKSLRKFSNPKKKNEFTLRGRGSRIEYAKKVGSYNAQTSISKEFAEWFAVYMDSNAESRQKLVSELYTRIGKLENELLQAKENGSNPDFQLTISALNSKVANQAEIIRDYEQFKMKALRDETLKLKSLISQLHTDIGTLKSEKAYLQNVVKNNYNSMEKGIAPVPPVPSMPVDGITMTIMIPKGSKVKLIEA